MNSSKVVKFTIQDPDLVQDFQKRKPVYLVLDNIRSAFNVGSAFRTGDATCVEQICICGISAYPPNPKLDKTALGSTKTVPWKYYKSTVEAIDELKAKKIHICSVELTNSSSNLWEYDFPEPVALVFGHEVYGISNDVLYKSDSFVYVPMYGKKATLNVSTTLGVALFEVLRQYHVNSLLRLKNGKDRFKN